MLNELNISVDPPPGVAELTMLTFVESERGMVIACSHYLEEIISDLLPKKMSSLGFETKVSIFSLAYHDAQLTPIMKVLVKSRNKASHSAEVFTLKDKELSFLSNFSRQLANSALMTKFVTSISRFLELIINASKLLGTF